MNLRLLPSSPPVRSRRVPLVAVALVMAFSMRFYVVHILIPHQVADARLHDRPRGNQSDLYPRWLGARELWLHGRNPYSAEVTREIQTGYYGRPLDPARPNDPIDQQAFAYPAYVTFVLAPTLHLPFETVRMIFTWLLAALTAVSVVWWFRVLDCNPGWEVAVAGMILAVVSIPGLQGVSLQQLSLLVCGLIAASALWLRRGWLRSAGVVLGFATIKPQLVAPLAGFLLLWSVSDWRARQRFFWAFLLCVACLVIGAQILLPGWVADWVQAVHQYLHYTDSRSRLEVLFGRGEGRAIALGFVLVAAFVAFQFRRAPAESSEFQLGLTIVLATTLVVVPNVVPYNQFLLLPAIFLVGREFRWRVGLGAFEVTAIAAAAFLAWPWMAALAMTVASLRLAPATLQAAWAIPWWAEFAIAPAFLLALLFLLGRTWKGAPNLP